MINFVAIDIETSGLVPNKQSKIFCIAVNDGISPIRVETSIEKVRNLLEDKRICKVIHNAAFDSYWLRYLYNIEVRNIWDTRLCEQILLGENLPRSVQSEAMKEQSSSSLKYTLKRYGLVDDMDKSTGKNFSTRNINAPLTQKEIEYAKEDVRHLLILQAMQERRLAKLDLLKVAGLENQVVEVVVRMRHRGVGFNEKIWLHNAAQNSLAYNQILKTMPPQVANWNSPAQIKSYFGGRGIHIGSLSNIEEIAQTNKDKELAKLIELRSLYKATTTYGASWLYDETKDKTVDLDNRVRADFEQILNTGRFSCSHPNLQQLPADGPYRGAFVPAKDYKFVIGDFAGQELGIMAAASEEKIWIDAMLRRDDIHSLTASLLYPDLWAQGIEKGCTFPKKCKCKVHAIVRQNAKTINFAIAYGAGPSRIGHNLKLTDREAMKLLNKYKRVVPRLTRWLNRNAESSVKTRLSFSADPYRRRRVLRDPENWMLSNIGKNNPVQACGANMIKLSMISLSPDSGLVLPIHDELILEVPTKKAEYYTQELKAVMEKSADYCTGIKGLIEVSPRIAINLIKQ